MADPLRVAVVGAGYFSRFQIAAWQRIDGVDLTAVIDREADRREWVSENHPLVPVGSDVGHALAVEPDILDIATPPATHAELIQATLGKIRTIICQKPFCATLEEAEDVAEEAAQSGTALFIHENFRFQPWYREVRKLLDTGVVGKVRQVRFALRPGDGEGPGAYLDRQPYFREMPRFLIRETGIHFIDTFRYLLGEPEAVYADLRQVNPVIVGEDSGIVVFDYPDGVRATFDGNRTLDHAASNRRLTMGEMELEGTLAAVRLSGDGGLALRQAGSNEWRAHEYSFIDKEFGGNCVEAFQTHMRDVALGRAVPETAAGDYLRNLRIEAAIYASAAEGRKVSLDA